MGSQHAGSQGLCAVPLSGSLSPISVVRSEMCRKFLPIGTPGSRQQASGMHQNAGTAADSRSRCMLGEHRDPKSHPATPTLTMWRRTYKLPHDVETTICWQTLLKLKISVTIIHYILSHDTHDVIP
jgi:hypothetical protein